MTDNPLLSALIGAAVASLVWLALLVRSRRGWRRRVDERLGEILAAVKALKKGRE